MDKVATTSGCCIRNGIVHLVISTVRLEVLIFKRANSSTRLVEQLAAHDAGQDDLAPDVVHLCRQFHGWNICELTGRRAVELGGDGVPVGFGGLRVSSLQWDMSCLRRGPRALSGASWRYPIPGRCSTSHGRR